MPKNYLKKSVGIGGYLKVSLHTTCCRAYLWTAMNNMIMECKQGKVEKWDI